MAKKVIPPTPAERTDPRSVDGREADPVIYTGTIDERMKALLKDHQEMGARPKREPATDDAAPASTPLGRVGTDDNGKTITDTPKATKTKK
jgi:hypothetical protein